MCNGVNMQQGRIIEGTGLHLHWRGSSIVSASCCSSWGSRVEAVVEPTASTCGRGLAACIAAFTKEKPTVWLMAMVAMICRGVWFRDVRRTNKFPMQTRIHVVLGCE